MLTVLLVSVLVGLLGVATGLVMWSPGQPAPLLDPSGQRIDGSVSERVFVNINGVRQGMFIQSANPANPVLLFLHGGPGMPMFFLNTTHPTGLEHDFTVVWWEQRGAGLSFHDDIPPETMTVDQLITDAVAVADYLRDRFGQDRIYLLGHSWGSFLGIQVAAAATDRFHAYIGMGQIAHQLRSEIAAHDYVLATYRANGDAAMVRQLEAAPVSLAGGTSEAWMRLRDKTMHELGVGTTRDMKSVITGIFVPVWRIRAYTVREKIAIWRGKAWSRRLLWTAMLQTDLAHIVERLDLPVYFFLGRHDFTTSYALALEFFDGLHAPVKGLYTFEHSAHSPLFEEPQRAREILQRDVLTRQTTFADPRR